MRETPAIATPASSFSLPPVERRRLANGARLAAARRTTSETAVLAGLLVGGATRDPQGREGLTSLATAVAHRATASRSYDAIYDELDALGASLSMGAGPDAIDIAGKCLSRDWRVLAELMVDVLRRPAFPEDELAKARGQALTHLRQLDQDTRSVAERELGHLVYPEGHPLRAPVIGYHASLEALSRDDLVGCHASGSRPDTLILTLVGNVPSGDALGVLAGLLADWERPAEAPRQPSLAAEHPADAQRAEFAMADKTQSDIALGFKGIPRTHPDWVALDQATQIVGGMGLMGRLGDSVRDRQGLAYYVYARQREGFGDGLWTVRAGVNPANVDQAVASSLDEVRRIQDEPVSDQELADVQSYLVGVLPIRLETNDGIAGALNSIELYGLGDDYVERYPSIIRSVTRDDIQRAAQGHLTAERYSLAIAGPARS